MRVPTSISRILDNAYLSSLAGCGRLHLQMFCPPPPKTPLLLRYVVVCVKPYHLAMIDAGRDVHSTGMVFN